MPWQSYLGSVVAQGHLSPNSSCSADLQDSVSEQGQCQAYSLKRKSKLGMQGPILPY